MFKKLAPTKYKVIIFDYSFCEVVKKCPEYPTNCRRIVMEG